MMVGKLTDRLSEQNIHVSVTDAAKDKIAAEGYDPEYGARPLIRAIQKTVEDNLSELILEGKELEGKNVTVDFDGESFQYDISERESDQATTSSEA